LVTVDSVSTFMPARPDHAGGLQGGPRPVSISTMHIRHMPTGFIRGW
jgi:hypothetical protein